MDRQTLLAQIDFSHSRLLGLFDTIEKSGANTAAVLAWRPGPGRAHIGWQGMHLAATLDRYLNVRIKGGSSIDPALVEHYAGGSTPDDDRVPSLPRIRQALEQHHADFRAFVAALAPEDMDKVIDFSPTMKRSLGESIILLTWHEAHHQGQIHLTWNLYKAAHGL